MSAVQFSETNLIGYLNSGISAADVTITVKFYDKITGAARVPDASTKMFVIDKGSSIAPNSNYEIILCGSHSTASGITTLATCTRGLAFTGSSLAAGTGKGHVANAEIGCADVHYLWTILANKLNGGEALGASLNFDIRPTLSGAGIFGGRIFADATARNAAITAPVNGDICYQTDTGVMYQYIGGAWATFASGVTVNAEEGTAGKVELATVAQQGTATDAGVSGAHLVVQNKNLVKTSSGAGDENKIAILGATGKYADGFQNITAADVTTLTGAGDASALHNHGETSQAGTGTVFIGSTTTGNIDIDVTPFTTAGKYILRYIVRFRDYAPNAPGSQWHAMSFDRTCMPGGAYTGMIGDSATIYGVGGPATPLYFTFSSEGADTEAAMISAVVGTGGRIDVTVQPPVWSTTNLRFSWASTVITAGNCNLYISVVAIKIG